MSIALPPPRPRKLSATPGQIALALGIAAFLALFLIWPTATVIYVAFTEKGGGAFTLVNFVDFFRTDLFLRSFWNSLYVSAMAVVGASVLALPLAYITSRFTFRGTVLIQTLGFLPLIMPPFVGAVAMQLFFGRNGSVNLLLDDCVRLQDPVHGRPQRRDLRAVDPLFSVHPDQPVGGAAQHRQFDGRSRAKSRRFRLPAVSPHRVSAGDARLHRRRFAGVRQSVRRSRHAAAAERQGHAGAAGLSARHLDRHRRSHGLCDLGGADRGLGRRHGGLGAGHPRHRLLDRAAWRRRPDPARAAAVRERHRLL